MSDVVVAAQLRRAATSVPLNIAEGSGCTSLPTPAATALIDEGHQISRMAHRFMQRLGTSTESPAS